jgi:hypothetical protein
VLARPIGPVALHGFLNSWLRVAHDSLPLSSQSLLCSSLIVSTIKVTLPVSLGPTCSP